LANYGISIGINNYIPPDKNGLTPLGYACDDAVEIHKWMWQHGGVPEANAILITSTGDNIEPVKAKIDYEISEMIKKIVEDEDCDADRFYFYFSGHGVGVELDSENNGLCMADWTVYLKDANSLSASSYKQKFISEGLFKEVIIWLDCCRNTKVNVRPSAHPGMTRYGKNNPLVFLGYATQYQSKAFEAASNILPRQDESRGIFTRVLLDGLKGAASVDGNRITADNLRDYLVFQTPLEAQLEGYLQDPEVMHSANIVKQMFFS